MSSALVIPDPKRAKVTETDIALSDGHTVKHDAIPKVNKVKILPVFTSVKGTVVLGECGTLMATKDRPNAGTSWYTLHDVTFSRTAEAGTSRYAALVLERDIPTMKLTFHRLAGLLPGNITFKAAKWNKLDTADMGTVPAFIAAPLINAGSLPSRAAAVTGTKASFVATMRGALELTQKGSMYIAEIVDDEGTKCLLGAWQRSADIVDRVSNVLRIAVGRPYGRVLVNNATMFAPSGDFWACMLDNNTIVVPLADEDDEGLIGASPPVKGGRVDRDDSIEAELTVTSAFVDIQCR